MSPSDEPLLPGVDPRAERSPVFCRLCGRPLTGREARTWGLGPECREKLRLRGAPRPRVSEVDQDTLPGV
ncbi:DUF6011 domain-containing protein [Streptomyces xiamenensis]